MTLHYSKPMAPTPPPFSLNSPSFASGLKRRAPSPPPSSQTPIWSSPVSEQSTPNKKRRPNLANGFSGLSLSEASFGTDRSDIHPDHEDDDIATSAIQSGDIGVEVLPETPSRNKRSSDRLWSNTGSTSSSTSDNESGNGYDSDATFRIPSSRKGRVQQPDSVHLPEPEMAHHGILDIEDLTESVSNRKRRHRDAESVPHRTRKKKRDEDDVDMNGDQPSLEDDIEEMTSGRSRRSHWYEPEKDRVVITSLSSSPSSSRSSSPDNTDRRHLTQPGQQGFTLSPSLLTHLLGKQKDNWNLPPMTDAQKGLVLYRPLGIPPGTSMQWDEIVKNWKDRTAFQDDSSRFEIVDDDEHLQSYGVEPIMPVINEYEQDVPMDVE